VDHESDHSEAELLSRYSMVRQFLSAMLATISFEAGPAGQPTMEALAALRGLKGRKKVSVTRCRPSSPARHGNGS